MAQWMADGGAPSLIARQWVLAFPSTCARGLLPVVVGKAGKDRDLAEATLRYLAFKGHRDDVETVTSGFGADVAAALSEVLGVDPRGDFMPKKFPALPRFWSADVHPAPRLLAGGKALPPDAVDALARMMSVSGAAHQTLALEEVLAACEPKSLANFAFSAFEEWAAKGDKASEWMFDTLAYLGDDDCARKLTPHIREWPRQNGTGKAKKGLEILAAIGSDVALTQIQAIALKNKYKPVLDCAQAMMRVIANARNLSPEQFEDRLVPTLGLSEVGNIQLDFGSRHFYGSVDEQLKPVLHDDAGALIKALPKSAKADDKELAEQAVDTWDGLCKELKPVAKLQLERLELAMVNSRRWRGADFKALLVNHPLMQSLVRGLVWGLMPSKGKLSKSFMVDARGECLDAQGAPVHVTDSTSVGIVHPLLLEESLGAWLKLFARNKQAQPFPQLVRKFYRAQDNVDKTLFGLEQATVPSKALKGLKAMGWTTDVGDAGWIWSFERKFASGSASISVDPGVLIDDYEPSGRKEQKLSVEVPETLGALEFSELIRELQTLRK